jgi:hypothetical protein
VGTVSIPNDPREAEGERIWLKVCLSDQHARKFARVLRQAAVRESDPDMARVLRQVAYKTVELGRGRLHVRKRPAARPRHDDPEAVRRVVTGDAPFPVLSRDDAFRAFLQMDRAGKSATYMAKRLYVDPRSIVRWREMFRTGKWKEPKE